MDDEILVNEKGLDSLKEEIRSAFAKEEIDVVFHDNGDFELLDQETGEKVTKDRLEQISIRASTFVASLLNKDN